MNIEENSIAAASAISEAEYAGGRRACNARRRGASGSRAARVAHDGV